MTTIPLDIDTTEGHGKVRKLDEAIEGTKENLIKMGNDVERETERSFNEVKGMMQASYMMVSGVTQMIGGSMSQAFAAIFQIGISAIGTYQAIAAAMAATGPAGWVQAGIMTTSLLTALVNLYSLSEGQTELSRRISGLNMSLHSISSMMGMYYA